MSIYEIGESLTNCDINMKNLLKNWVPKKIVNANEYEFLEWSFVETISDSSRYVYYRNYFSTDEPVYQSQSRKVGSSFFENKHEEYDSLWVYPGFLYPHFHDTRGLPDKARAIFSDDFKLRARKIASMELNIDTLKLNFYYFHQTDTIKDFGTNISTTTLVGTGASGFGGGDSSTGKSWSTIIYDIATIDSLSQNYIDLYFTRQKSPDDLSIEEKRELTLEELLIERLLGQIRFSERVKIGDKVFVIKFKHKNKNELNYKFYNNYIICCSETHKVLWDTFFQNITLKVYK
jgi:hypothetical protein